jgi:hypothetical protein
MTPLMPRVEALLEQCAAGTHKKSAGRCRQILTVTVTCRQQGRNVLDHLVAACEAHARGEPAPSLLPQAAEVRLAKRGG